MERFGDQRRPHKGSKEYDHRNRNSRMKYDYAVRSFKRLILHDWFVVKDHKDFPALQS
jgi:hypothetical protein